MGFLGDLWEGVKDIGGDVFKETGRVTGQVTGALGSALELPASVLGTLQKWTGIKELEGIKDFLRNPQTRQIAGNLALIAGTYGLGSYLSAPAAAAAPTMDTLASGGAVYGTANPWTAASGANAFASTPYAGLMNSGVLGTTAAGTMYDTGAPAPKMDTLANGGVQYGNATPYSSSSGAGAVYGPSVSPYVMGEIPWQEQLGSKMQDWATRQGIKQGVNLAANGLLSSMMPQFNMPTMQDQANLPDWTYKPAQFGSPTSSVLAQAQQAAAVEAELAKLKKIKPLSDYLSEKKDWLSPHMEEK
jgi:hypothetical protein